WTGHATSGWAASRRSDGGIAATPLNAIAVRRNETSRGTVTTRLATTGTATRGRPTTTFSCTNHQPAEASTATSTTRARNTTALAPTSASTRPARRVRRTGV